MSQSVEVAPVRYDTGRLTIRPLFLTFPETAKVKIKIKMETPAHLVPGEALPVCRATFSPYSHMTGWGDLFFWLFVCLFLFLVD